MKLKVGVCENPAELTADDWSALAARVRRESPELFLLNEMPFGSWISAGTSFERSVWERSVEAHDAGLLRLGDLGAKVVAGSRPRDLSMRRVNEAFTWITPAQVTGVHTKQFFPDEEGYFETRWFEPGPRHFEVADVGGVRIGFLICTEVMFNEHARRYGRDGAQMILVPRAVGRESLRRWLVALRMAAIVSGCYVLSSNRSGMDTRGQRFGGAGWIIDPNGDVVARTSRRATVAFHEVDTDFVAEAQRSYPCYVLDS